MNIYDFDGTIYDGDSSKDFFIYSLKRNKKIILDIIPICFGMLLYLIKIIEKEKFKSIFFRFIRRIDVDKYVKDFWKYNEYKIKDFYKKQKKKDDIIVSASPEFLLKPIAQKYHFKLIATKVNKKTGKLIGLNCHGEEKVKRLKNINITKCNSFYSDSLSDIPCSKLAISAFIVNKNEIIKWEDYKLSKSQKLIMQFLDRDFFTFLFIGVINTFNGVWIALLYSLIINNPTLAYVLGFITSLMISYILNSKLNFKSKLLVRKFIKFAINNIPNFIIQVLSVTILLNILDLSKIISYSVSAIIAVPITFLLVKFNVYKK